jgi:hypothetical protein
MKPVANTTINQTIPAKGGKRRNKERERERERER